MEYIAALLNDKPTDIDFSLLNSSEEVAFIKKFYTKFGYLPDKSVFEKEVGVELPVDFAPWQYYETKFKEEKFIRDAIPALTKFNSEYDKDQKKALLQLREKLVTLAVPEEPMKAVSIIKDLSRYERFKDTDNARIPTGLKPLDEASGGISRKDEFMLIVARLGVGKSWVAHYIAKSMAVAGYKVGLYSGEMSEDEVGARFDSLLSHISNYAITRGKDIDLTEHLLNINSVPGDLVVLTASHLRHNATPSDLRTFAKNYNLDVLLIDQIPLLEPDGKRGGEDFERKALLSFQLKSLQQELQIPIVAVNQLNRNAAQQEPDTSNISGSDRFGQDATLIITLGRKTDGTDEAKSDILKVKVLKARSFRMPDQPWEFTWDIDKGILEPRLDAMDAVKAKIAQAKAKEASRERAQPQQSTDAGSDEIW